RRRCIGARLRGCHPEPPSSALSTRLRVRWAWRREKAWTRSTRWGWGLSGIWMVCSRRTGGGPGRTTSPAGPSAVPTRSPAAGDAGQQGTPRGGVGQVVPGQLFQRRGSQLRRRRVAVQQRRQILRQRQIVLLTARLHGSTADLHVAITQVLAQLGDVA